MGSLDGGSPVPVLGRAPQPDQRAGSLSELKLPPLDLRGWEADLAKLSIEDRAKFVQALEERVNALRAVRDLRSLGEDKVKEADAANEASIKRRDEQLAELFRANPTLKGLFDRMEQTLERQIADELPKKDQPGTAVGTARMIRACLEGMPPDTATVFEILRDADPARLAAIRESFRSTMAGAEPVEKQIEMYLDGIPGLKDQDRELLLRLFGGSSAEFEGTALAAALHPTRGPGDPPTGPEARMVLRGELSAVLGETPDEVTRRVESYNRMTSRRELLERWLEQELKDPVKLKEFRDWEAAFTGEAGKKTVLFDRWIRRGGLTAEQSARFEAYVEANIAKEPDHFARAVEAQLGAGTQYIAWLNARSSGNVRLADAIMLVESVQMEKAPARDVLMFLMRMTPQDRQDLAEAYYQKYGAGNPAYAADHSKCLYDAVTERKDRALPDPWTDATRKVLGAYLSGQQVDQRQLEVDLAVSALGFRPGMKEGEIARINPADFNFLLAGKSAEERSAFVAQVEAEIGRCLTTPAGKTRVFNIDPAKPGAAIEAYMARYSDTQPEQVTVLTVRQEHLDEIRRLSTRVNRTELPEAERQEAARELDALNKQLETERLRYKRAEEQLRRGEIAVLPADLAGDLKYFEKDTITTIDRRTQWTQLVRTLISEGSQDEGRVSQYVLRVEGGDPRSRQLMEYARMLDGDISHSLMNVRGTTSNLIRSWSDYRESFQFSRHNILGGFFCYCSGATDEAAKGIRREEADVERRMTIFVETQERTKRALAGMTEQSRQYQALEINGNVSELLGDYVSAQQHYNQAQLAYRKAEEAILQAHNKSVEDRVRQNQTMIRDLAEANERLTKVDETLAGYQEAIVKTGVIVGATAVCIATGGAASVVAMGAWQSFGVAAAAGTGAGFGLSLGARTYQYSVQGRGGEIGGQQFWSQVGDDTFDAAVASIGARGASGFTQTRTLAAATRGQIVQAHVMGNFIGAGTMFAGNTGKSVFAVYGGGPFEGAMARRERELGRPLTSEERTQVLEAHRLTAGQLSRDGFTYFITSWAGGKISGHTQALGGSFQQIAPGVARHVAFDPGTWTRTLGATNFVGQTGVAFLGNGLNYLYYARGLETEFHFDAGLLVAPVGNLSFGGPRGGRHGGSAPDGPTPSGGGHGPGGGTHAPGTAHPTGAPEHVTVNGRSRATLEATAAGHDAEAARHPSGSTEARTAEAKAAVARSDAARLQVDDAHGALADAKSTGTKVQVAEAEAALHRAQRAGLELEQTALDRRKAATSDPAVLADLATEQTALDRRRSAHAEDVLATHKETHSEPLGRELLVRRQLEVEAAQARLRAHDSECTAPTKTDNARRARLEADLARAELEQHRVTNPGEQVRCRELENAELAARERQIKATSDAFAERRAAGESIPEKETSALSKLRTECAADSAATALRRDIEDHGAAPTDPARRAERSRLTREELDARKDLLELREKDLGKKATAAEKADLEIAKKTYERDLAQAQLDGHVSTRLDPEDLTRILNASEEQVIRARERQCTEEQRMLDSSRAKGEAVDPVTQARTTEKQTQIESDRAARALERAESQLQRHIDEKAMPLTAEDAAQRARLESDVEQRKLILDHEQKAAAAAKAKREATELEHSPGEDPAAVSAARRRAALAADAEETSRPQAEAAHKRLVDEATVRRDEAKANSEAAPGDARLLNLRQRAETDLCRVEADAARMRAEAAARELQRHCLDNPQLNDSATITRRFELEAQARDARKEQAQADIDFARCQEVEKVKGADKRREQAEKRLEALKADEAKDPARQSSREDEAAARRSVTDAEAVVDRCRYRSEDADAELAAHRELLADNPELAADRAEIDRLYQLEDNSILSRQALDDATRNHRLAEMKEELGSATGARKNELERAIARTEAEAREIHAKRAEGTLELFGRRRDGELADPLLDPKRRTELMTERRVLEDQANQQRADYLTEEITRVRKEMNDLPPTLDVNDRYMALKRKLDTFELRQAETTAQRSELDLKRHQSKMLELESGERPLFGRRPKMTEADWQERHRLMEAELKSREALLERQLADAQTKHGDPAHPAVHRCAAELAEARAAAANMGTPENPGKYFAAEQARHDFEVSKVPVDRAQAAYDALIAKFGFDPKGWTTEQTAQIRQQYKVLEREIGRTGINGRRKQVEALDKQYAWETERNKAIRRELGLGDRDAIPETSRRGWGEDRRRPIGSNTEAALEQARSRLRQEERDRWGSAGKWAKRGLGLAVSGYMLRGIVDMKDQLGNLWDGLDFYENDNGYMYGRSDDGGPVDEAMYSAMSKAKPEELLGIATEHLRLVYGRILSDEDIERFAKRIVAAGNGGVPSQMAIREIISEADTLAADASNIQRMLIERTNVPPPPPRPTHGVGGFYDLERVKAEGLHLPPRS